MKEINQLMNSALSAQPVSDSESEDLKQQIIKFVKSQNAFATQNLTIDSIEQEAMTSTSVWNEDVVRMEVESGFGGDVEVISLKDKDENHISMDMSLGISAPQSTGKTYMHADSDDLSEFMDYDMPDEVRSHDFYLNMIEQSVVSVTENTVFLQNTVSTDDLNWLNSETFKQDVTTEGMSFIMTYDTQKEQLENQLLTIRNSDAMNTHIVAEYLYDEKFSFNIPDLEDDNVFRMSEAMNGVMGGGQDGLFGGSVDDIFGDGIDDIGLDEDNGLF